MGFIGGAIDIHPASATDESSSASSMTIDVACFGSEADLLTCATVSDATMNGIGDRCIDGTPVAVTCSQDAGEIMRSYLLTH